MENVIQKALQNASKLEVGNTFTIRDIYTYKMREGFTKKQVRTIKTLLFSRLISNRIAIPLAEICNGHRIYKRV